MLVALQMQCVVYMSIIEARETPMIFSAVLTIRCRVLLLETDDDAAAQDTLHSPPVEHGEDGRGEPSQMALSVER